MDRRLLEHLLKKGVLDSAQLRSAHQRATQSGENILDVVLDQGMTRDVILARALGSFYKYKVVDIGRVNPKQEALDRASGSFCIEHTILPFAVDKQSGDLLVAVFDPARSHSVLDAFQRKTGQKLRIYIAPRDALKTTIQNQYPNADVRKAPSRSLGLADLSHYEVSSMSQVPGLGDSHFDAGTLSRMGFSPSGPSPSKIPRSTTGSGYAANVIDRFFSDEPDSPPANPAAPASPAVSNEDILALRQENEALRNHIHRLEMSLQLEINLVRKLTELLLEHGVIDQQSYLEKMGRLR